MNKNDLYLAIGNIDEKLLLRSEKAAAKIRSPKIVRVLSIAAVICLMIGGTAFLGSAGILTYDLFFRGAGAAAPPEAAADSAKSEAAVIDEIEDELTGDAMIPDGEAASYANEETRQAAPAPTLAPAANENKAAVSTGSAEPLYIALMITLAGTGLGIVLLFLVLIFKIIAQRRKKA